MIVILLLLFALASWCFYHAMVASSFIIQNLLIQFIKNIHYWFIIEPFLLNLHQHVVLWIDPWWKKTLLLLVIVIVANSQQFYSVHLAPPSWCSSLLIIHHSHIYIKNITHKHFLFTAKYSLLAFSLFSLHKTPVLLTSDEQILDLTFVYCF